MIRLENHTLRVVDLLEPGETIVRDAQLFDCVLHGPAILLPMHDVALDSPSMHGNWEGLIWLQPDERKLYVGAVGLASCMFVRCEFVNVGFAIKDDLAQKFAAETWVEGS